jgi:hypothetical protein
MRKPRRNHSAAFKARVALEAIRGEKTVAQIAAHHGCRPLGRARLHGDLPHGGIRPSIRNLASGSPSRMVISIRPGSS